MINKLNDKKVENPEKAIGTLLDIITNPLSAEELCVGKAFNKIPSEEIFFIPEIGAEKGYFIVKRGILVEKINERVKCLSEAERIVNLYSKNNFFEKEYGCRDDYVHVKKIHADLLK